MRRLLTISAALLLAMALALPSQAGPKPRDKHVSNDQVTALTLQAWWGFWDEESGVQRNGFMNVYEMEAGTFIDYWDSYQEPTDCTPDDPDDDDWGESGYEIGTGDDPEPLTDVSFEILGRYDEGHASATLTLYGHQWSSCDGYDDEVNWTVEVDLHLLGTTPILRERDSYSLSIPSFYNQHQSGSFRGRFAEGTLTIHWGADESEEFPITEGRIGLMQFKAHTNS